MENTQINTTRRVQGAALASQQGCAAAHQVGAMPKRKVCARGLSRKTASLLPLEGGLGAEIARGVVEMAVLLLLLAGVLGWMGLGPGG